MKFVAREMDWFKRRTPKSKPPKIVNWTLVGFEKIHNHECEMWVKFSDGKEYDLSARVHQNVLAKPERWSVQGLNAQGISVVLDLIE